MYITRCVSQNMLEKKRLQFDLEVKSIGQDGRFSGYASVFGVVDNHNDVILRGAFQDTLKERTKSIKLLWQHRQDEPIGVFEQIFEDEMGLYVQGRLLLDVARAREAYALLKQGALSGLSIGYSPVHYTIDAGSGTRILSEIALWEISLVTFPANAAAGVTVVKQSFQEADAGYDVEEDFDAGLIRSGSLIALQDALDRAAGVIRV